MGDFENTGFLGEEIRNYICHRDLTETEKRVQIIVAETNALLHEFKRKIEVKEENAVDLTLAALFARLIQSFSASVILCQYGLSHDAHAVARNLVVGIFIIKSIIDKPRNLDRYVAKYLQETQKRLEKIKKKDYLGQNNQEEVSNKIEEYQTLFDSLVVQGNLTEKSFAVQAGMEDDYDSFYAAMSSFVHTSISTLDRFLKTDVNGSVKEFDIGPNFDGVPLLLLSCCSYVLQVVDSLSQHYGIEKPATHKKISTKIGEELKILDQIS